MSLTKGKVDAATISIPTEPASASALFSGLQRRFRRELQTVLSVSSLLLAEAKGTTHYGVTMTRVSEVLQQAGLPLDSFEVEFLRSRFSNHRDEVNFAEVLTALNVGKPVDYIDPDLIRDPLPQPFRMITELFETEILDRAWIEVLQRHPDLPIDSNGKQIVVPRNKNLAVCAVPSVINDGKPTRIVSMKTPPVGVFSFGISSSGTLITM